MRVVGARPLPFTLFTISCSVRSSWEGRYTHPISSLPLLCNLCWQPSAQPEVAKTKPNQTFVNELYCIWQNCDDLAATREDELCIFQNRQSLHHTRYDKDMTQVWAWVWIPRGGGGQYPPTADFSNSKSKLMVFDIGHRKKTKYWKYNNSTISYSERWTV